MNHLLVILNISSNEMWKTFIDTNFTCLCWGVIGLVVLVFLLKYFSPFFELCIKNRHEMKVKDKAFEMEKYWFEQNSKKEKQELVEKIKKQVLDEIKSEVTNTIEAKIQGDLLARIGKLEDQIKTKRCCYE